MNRSTENELSRFAGLSDKIMSQLSRKDLERVVVIRGFLRAGDITLANNGHWHRWFLSHSRELKNFDFIEFVTMYAKAQDIGYQELEAQEADALTVIAERQEKNPMPGTAYVMATAGVADYFYNQRELYFDEHWHTLATAALALLEDVLEADELL